MAEELVLKADFNIAKAQAKINKLTREFNECKRKADEISGVISKLNEKLSQNKTDKFWAEKALERANAEVDRLQAKLDNTKIDSVGRPYIVKDLENAQAEAQKWQDTCNRLDKKNKEITAEIAKQNNALDKQKNKVANIRDNINATKNEQTRFGKAIKKSDNPLEKFANRIKGLAKRVFIFSVITKALRSMRDALSGYIAQDSKLSGSIAKLKGNLATIGATLSSAISPILTVIVDKLVTVTSIIGRTFAKLLGKNVKQMQKLANSTQDTADNAEKATASFDTLQKIDTSKKGSDTTDDSISKDTSAINTTAFDESIDKFLSKLEPLQEKVKTNFEKIAESATNAFEKNKPLFEKAYNEFFAPVGEWAYDEFQEIVDEIGDGVSKIIDYFATDEFAEIFDEIIVFASGVWAFVKPILDELSEVVGAIFTSVADTISATFQTISGAIEFIGGTLEFFLGLIEYVVEVFTDDTEKMTEGSKLMKDGIKLALNGIIKLFAGLVNGLSSAINFIWDVLISAVRGIVNGLGSVVSWAGKLLGKDDWGWKWEYEQPHIPKWNPPKLATGAVLPGGSPMLAWVNDQPKGQGYIEGSVENIAAAFEKYRGNHDFGGSRNITIEANGNWAQFIKWMNLQVKEESARASMYS